MDFYVYGHFDENDNCRYIGKGRNKRAWSFSQRSKRWHKTFTQEKYPTVKILKDNLSEQDAYETEIHAISYAIKSGANLLNITAGGLLCEGWDDRAKKLLSEDRKGHNWTFGVPRPQETRDKISATKKANNEIGYWAGKKRDPEHMKKFIASAQTPEAREKMGATKRGKKHTEEHKKKIKDSLPKKKVICITTNEEFESINDAAKAKNLGCGRVSEVVNGLRKSAKGLIFAFKESQSC